MTKSFTKWSSLALALASTGAGAASPPNYDALWEAPVSPRTAPRSAVQQGARMQTLKAPELGAAHRDDQGAPTFVWAKRDPLGAMRLRQLQGMKPEEAAREQLAAYLPLYGHTTLADAGADLTAVSRDAAGVTVLTFAQKVDGVPVFRQELKVLLDASNTLVAIGGGLSPATTSARMSAKAMGLRAQRSAAQAIAVAYTDLTGARLDGTLLERMSTSRAGDDEYTHYQLATYARPLAQGLVIPARARSVLYPLPGGLVPAYYLELNTAPENSQDSDYYAYVVSATDGRILMRNNLTAHASFGYRVWAETQAPFTPLDGPSGGTVTPHPTGVPNTVPTPPFVAPSLLTLQNAPFSRNDPWLAADATQSLGNNVDAYADLVLPNGYSTGDLRATVTAPGVFDRTMDMTQAPNANAEQIKAAVTQLFYVNNWLHDWYYDSGFGEVDGNAQTSNFGRGGKEKDPILAEAQDNSGTNNANMSTPADGASPRMQMYIFTAPTPSVDKQNVEATAPASVAGRYATGSATFGAQVFDVPATEVVVASSDATNNTLGCTAFNNAAAVAGKIAYVDRGTCPFVDKAKNAQNAGAVGLILGNNVEGLISPSGTDATITLPILSVGLADAQKLRAAVPGLVVKLHREPVPSLDGTIDNGIVAHEWGHYISNRLVMNAAGLSNNQGRSMGEGWADFHALLMMTRAEDINVAANANWNGVYTSAEYATRGAAIASRDSTFFGIRRVAYSADMTKNALTFKHIDNNVALPTTAPIAPNSSVNSEVHNSGEVWATMLWDCYVSLLRAYPFNEAQQRMKSYLLNGYKLTPASPTFLEARDALIAAAYAGNRADGDRFWRAFARRGAGGGALAPSKASSTHVGVLESYDFIALTAATLELPKTAGQVCDTDDILDNGETALLRLTVRNVGPDQTEPTDLRVLSSSTHLILANGGRVQVPPLKQGAEAEVVINVSAQNATAREAVILTTTTHQDSPSAVDNIKSQLNLVLNYDEAANTSATEDVEASSVPWFVQSSGNPSPGAFGITTYPTLNNHVFYGPNGAVSGDMSLLTPALTVSTTQPFVLNFKQSWDFEFVTTSYYDGAVIELSQDEGATWVDVGAPLYNGTIAVTDSPITGRKALVGTSPGFPTLLSYTLNLGTTYAGKTVRLRFRIGTDSGGSLTGWLLDDLAFSGITNTPFTSLIAEDGVCVSNFPPTVNAGADVSAYELSTVNLRGSVSAPSGTSTSAEWKQLSGPAVNLKNPLTLNPSFVAPEVTANTLFVFQLTGTANNASATDTVAVTVLNVNHAPTVNAGVAGIVDERANYTLMGSASDVDGDPLTYAWTQVSGTPVTLRNATTLQASFTAPEVLLDETIPFTLAVSDGQTTTRASVNVTVRNVNRAPIANAGDSFYANTPGATVQLNGTRSADPDGDAITYAWTQVAGPAVTLTDDTTATPSFTAPTVSARTELRFQLVVKDAALSSAPSTVTVTLSSTTNSAPTVNAGVTGMADERTPYTLMGSASDPDGDPLTYRWVQTAGTTARLSDATVLQPSFTVPEVRADETLTFELSATDGQFTTRATVDVMVRNVNRTPVANAGTALTASSGATVRLNGTLSADPDGDAITYAWTQTSGPTVTLSSATVAAPTFTAPSVSAATELRFQLVVKDATLSSAPATVTVTVKPVNRAPVVSAGTKGSVNERASYTLTGTASDPDGDPLTYKWVQTAGTAAALYNSTTLQASFTAPDVSADETLTFELAATDGLLTTRSTVEVVVRNVNRAPTANAGAAFSVNARETARLNGTRSSDPDGDALSYTWTQISGPSVTLTGATTATPSFTAPSSAAQLRFYLVVKDASLSSEPSTVTVTVNPVNRAPTANAGVAGTVDERTSYTLSGSASDPDDDALTYTWVQKAGPQVALRNANTLQPSFTAPEVTLDETLTFELSVNDGQATTRASVNVTVRNVNRAPIASAGDAFSVQVGGSAQLNGGRSIDADGDALSYTWTQVAGPAVTLTGATTATPSFTAPSTPAELRFQLVVKDASLSSEPAFVTVTVTSAPNRAPTANAGMTGTVDERANYTLMGTASDADGDTLTYAWVQKAGTAVALRNATTLQPSFTAPEVTADETLTFELAVSDGKATTRATVDVLVRNVNHAPVANAGEAFSINAGDTARLNGGRSTDSDGDALSYTWTQVAGPTVTLTGATTATPSFTAPVVDTQTELRFQLVVKDASLSSEPAFVTVTVKHVNRAPTANAGTNGTVDERALYAFSGSGSDADGDTLSFTWVQKSGTAVALRNATTPQASFTAPEVTADETLTFELAVSDGKATARATVDVLVRNVNRAPTANAGEAFSVNAGDTARLNGGRSTDADGDALSYTWTQVAGPTVTLTGATTATPSFTAPSVNAQTELRFQLVVKDASLSSEPAFVTVTVKPGNRAPTANAGMTGTVDERALYALSGSGSDADGDTLSFTWVQKAGTPVALRNATTPQASFIAPEVTADETLTFELAVSDGKATTRATVDVLVRNVNRVPTANAGTSLAVNAGEPVSLNGNRSSDPDGDVLSYTWTQVAGPAVTLTGATTVTASFTAPSVNAQTDLRFQLVVKDASSISEPSSVTITVKPGNRAPTVNAGVAGVVEERASYTLTGSASDADGDTLTYTWVQKSGTPAALRNATALQASFIAPEVSADETLTFELTANDGKATTRATVDVLVRNVNRAPSAFAGDSFSVNAEAPAELNGGRSTDADGDTLTYAWTQVAGPTVTLSGATTSKASFTAPSVEGQTELRFQLVVKDASLNSEPAFVTVTVIPKPVVPTTPEQRGCSSTGAGAPLGLFGLALLALARRRRVMVS